MSTVKTFMALMLVIALSGLVCMPTVVYADNILAEGESGKYGDNGDGFSGLGGFGGDASFTAGTLTVKTIELVKNDGDLIFHVGTLDVSSGSTTLMLDGTAAGDVFIDTINLGGSLEVKRINNGDFSFNTLNVLGADATYTGSLNAAGKTITFDLNSVGKDETMLTVNGDCDLTEVKIDLRGTPNFEIGDEIILVECVGAGRVLLWNSSTT